MSDPTDDNSERRLPDWMRRPARRPSDLEILQSHPSLTSLADKGSLLHRLPLTSTAWTIAGALLVTLAAFGTVPALVVVMITVLAILFTLSAMHLRDLTTARAVLTFARVCLLAWLLSCAGAPWFA